MGMSYQGNQTNIGNSGNVTGFNIFRSSDAIIIVRSIAIVTVSLAIITSNLINFAVLSSTSQIPTTARIWLLNLSTADFLIGLVVCLPCVAPAISGEWPYGIVWCQIAGVVHGTCATVSIWSLAVLSIDRCLAMIAPMKYKTKLKVKTCARVCGVLWVAGFLSFISPNIFSANFVYYKFQEAYLMCGLYWESPWLTLIAGALVPYLSAFVILGTTLKICLALRRIKRLRQNRTAWPVRTESCREEKAVKLIIVTAVVYFVAWGPYLAVTFYVLYIPGGKEAIPIWVQTVTIWAANANSFLNVVIYSSIYRAFRARAKLLILSAVRCRCCRADSRIHPHIFHLPRTDQTPAEVLLTAERNKQNKNTTGQL